MFYSIVPIRPCRCLGQHILQKSFKKFRKKDPMDFTIDNVNDNLKEICMSKTENEKDRELRDYCIRRLAEKKYMKEMDLIYRSCMSVLG